MQTNWSIPAFYAPTAIKGKNHNNFLGFGYYLNGLCNSDQSSRSCVACWFLWHKEMSDKDWHRSYVMIRSELSGFAVGNPLPQWSTTTQNHKNAHQHWEGNKLRTQHSREYTLPCQSYNVRISIKKVYSNPQSCWCMQQCFSWQWHQWIAIPCKHRGFQWNHSVT